MVFGKFDNSLDTYLGKRKYLIFNCSSDGQKSLNFTCAFKCYQQSWLHFSWATLYISLIRCLLTPYARDYPRPHQHAVQITSANRHDRSAPPVPAVTILLGLSLKPVKHKTEIHAENQHRGAEICTMHYSLWSHSDLTINYLLRKIITNENS